MSMVEQVIQSVGGSYKSGSTQYLWLYTTTLETTNGPQEEREKKSEQQVSILRDGFKWVGNYL
jgi:hypothetical protein